MKRNQRAKLIAATAAAITALLGTKPQITIAKPTAGTAHTTGTAGGTAPATRLPKLEPLTVHPHSIPAKIGEKPLLTVASGVKTTVKHKSRITVAAPAAQSTTSLIPDDSLGTNATTVSQSGNVYTVNGTNVSSTGVNQFESFSTLNLAAGDTLQFNTASTVSNLLVRVTGGSASNINGTLSYPTNLNLFLLNKAGFVIGSNAILDLDNLMVTSADQIGLADGHHFSASSSSGVSPYADGQPNTLVFTSGNNGAVTLDHANPTQTQEQSQYFLNLAVAAPAINASGGSFNGNSIQLVSVASGTLKFTTGQVDPPFTFDTSAVIARGSISIIDNPITALTTVIGSNISISNSNITPPSESTMQIDASGTLSVTDSAITMPENESSGITTATITASTINLSGTTAAPTSLLFGIGVGQSNPPLTLTADQININGAVTISTPGSLVPVVNCSSFTLNGKPAYLQIDQATQSISLTPTADTNTIQLDGSTGTAEVVQGPTFDITSAMGTTVGNNLFISVNALSLAANETIQFSPAPDIRAVIVRVTGGQPTRIAGTFDTSAETSLYLINPAGVLVQGSSNIATGPGFTSLAFTAVNAMGFAGGGSVAATASPIPFNATGLPISVTVASATHVGSVRISNASINANMLLAGPNIVVQQTTMLSALASDGSISPPTSAGNPGGLTSTTFAALRQGTISLPADPTVAPTASTGDILGSLTIQGSSQIRAISPESNFLHPYPASSGGYSAVHLLGNSITIADSTVEGPDEEIYNTFASSISPPPTSLTSLTINAVGNLAITGSSIASDAGEPGAIQITAETITLLGSPQSATVFITSGGALGSIATTPSTLTVAAQRISIDGDVQFNSNSILGEFGGAPFAAGVIAINASQQLVYNGQRVAAAFDSVNGTVIFAPIAGNSSGDVATDGTLGIAVQFGGAQIMLGSADGAVAGGNLFFSFKSFQIAAGQTVTINAPTATANVIMRVTGNAPAQIYGALNSASNATIYLLDPAGFSFQDGSRLNVAGTICLAAAQAIRFSDGVVLNTSLSSSPTLSSASPSAVQLTAAAATAEFSGKSKITDEDDSDPSFTEYGYSQLSATGTAAADVSTGAPVLGGLSVIAPEVDITDFVIETKQATSLKTSSAGSWVNVTAGSPLSVAADADTAGVINITSSAIGGGTATNLIAGTLNSVSSTIGQSMSDVTLSASVRINLSGQFASGVTFHEVTSVDAAPAVSSGPDSYADSLTNESRSGNILISAPSVVIHDATIDTGESSALTTTTFTPGNVNIIAVSIAANSFAAINGGGAINLTGAVTVDDVPGNCVGGLFAAIDPPTLDSTFGAARQLSLGSPNEYDLVDYVVNSSDGRQSASGSNEFFSFKYIYGTGILAGAVDVFDAESALSAGIQFNLAPNVQNVFIRVTGGPATLEGNFDFTQKVNLFITDAAGITMHGANFNNGGGSTFILGNANVRLADGSVFPAAGVVGAVSLTAQPSSIQVLGPVPISVERTTPIPENEYQTGPESSANFLGNAITIGGELTVDGPMMSQGSLQNQSVNDSGTVSLYSVSRAATFPIVSDTLGLTAQLSRGVAMGDITMDGGSLSGPGVTIGANNLIMRHSTVDSSFYSDSTGQVSNEPVTITGATSIQLLQSSVSGSVITLKSPQATVDGTFEPQFFDYFYPLAYQPPAASISGSTSIGITSQTLSVLGPASVVAPAVAVNSSNVALTNTTNATPNGLTLPIGISAGLNSSNSSVSSFGGNLTLTADHLSITGPTGITALTDSTGTTGKANIMVSQEITMDGGGAYVSDPAFGILSGISAPQLTISAGVFVDC
jgi:filamentous hemagglutinin family protein